METEKWFKGMLESFEGDLDFRLEMIILDVTERISKRMKEKGISRTKLAELLKVSPPAVTKFLNGKSNFTLRKLLLLADALELQLKVDFKDKNIVATKPYRYGAGIVAFPTVQSYAPAAQQAIGTAVTITASSSSFSTSRFESAIEDESLSNVNVAGAC